MDRTARKPRLFLAPVKVTRGPWWYAWRLAAEPRTPVASRTSAGETLCDASAARWAGRR